MGISGLYTYINRIPDSYKNVNISEELRKYQTTHSRQPIIIINLWTIVFSFEDFKEARLARFGYRVRSIESKFERFLQKLKEADAELVFVFKKPQISYDEDSVISKDEVKSIDDRHEQKMLQMFILAQVAKRFGQLRGMDSIKNRPSTFQIQLANELNAFAIMGLNTHYVFYEGPWAFWSDADMDMESMTIRQYSKEKFMQHLNLTVERAPLFAMLAGSLCSSEPNVKKTKNYFKPSRYADHFSNVATFVNRRRNPPTDDDLRGIVKEIFHRCDDDTFNDFKQTLRLMDSSQHQEFITKVDPDIKSLIRDDISNYAEEILENAAILISVDERLSSCEPSISDLVEQFIQRTAGLLLKNSERREPVTVLVKAAGRSRIKGRVHIEKKIPPIIPEFDVAELRTLVSGEISNDAKLEILLWLSGLDLSMDDLETVQDESMMDIIICLHLYKTGTMKLWEAECLIRSIAFTRRNRDAPRLPYDAETSPKAKLLLSLYTKVFFVLYSCFAAVGLKNFQNDLMVDGLYFQVLYADRGAIAADEEAQVSIETAFAKLLEAVNDI